MVAAAAEERGPAHSNRKIFGKKLSIEEDSPFRAD